MKSQLRQQSTVFDRAAPFYDRSRALAPAVAEALTQALMAQGRLAAARQVLEIGVGTGRIAVPLLERGVRLTGLDLSRPMMAEMRRKWADARLIQGDASRPPFAADTFDAVLIVHVLHLIPTWQQTLAEMRRLLRPNGILLHSWTDRDQESAGMRVVGRFFERVQARGEPDRRVGMREREELTAFLREHGWALEEIEVASWQSEDAPITLIERIRSRQWSSTWDIPDAIMDETLAELEGWTRQEYGALDRPQPQAHRLMLDVLRPSSE